MVYCYIWFRAVVLAIAERRGGWTICLFFLGVWGWVVLGDLGSGSSFIGLGRLAVRVGVGHKRMFAVRQCPPSGDASKFISSAF